MTRKELNAFISNVKEVKHGYGCFANEEWDIKKRCKEIGYNSGIYGWNWSLYYDPVTDAAYIDGYRNY